MDVAATRVDAHLANDGNADVTKLLVLAVGERERRRHCHRVTGVHPHRVHVLDRAHNDDVVVLVAHEFEFILLPPKDRLFKEHLGGRRVVKTRARDATQIILVVGEPRTKAAHREGGTDDDGVLQILSRLDALIHRVTNVGASTVRTTALNNTLEEFAVLAKVDGVEVGADEFDVVPVEDSRLGCRNGGVEGSLASQRRQQSVRTLLRDDALNNLGRDRFDVGGVGEFWIGHDRRGVRVEEDNAQPLGLEHTAGLRARVVELACLADDDGTGSDHHHGVDVVAAGH